MSSSSTNFQSQGSSTLSPALAAAMAAGGSLINIREVASLSDLPAPVAGIIPLDPAVTYFVTSEVDLGANTLQCGGRVKIDGFGASDAGFITSAPRPLLDVSCDIYLNGLTLTNNDPAGRCLNGSGLGPTAYFQATNVRFRGSGEGVYIENYGTAIFERCSWSDVQSGIVADGTFSSLVVLDSAFFALAAGGVGVSLAAGITLNRRFRLTDTTFNLSPGQIGIDVGNVAALPDKSLVINGCDFIGGGTNVNGATADLNQCDWGDNQGIEPTRTYASGQQLPGTAGVTPISVVGTYVTAVMPGFALGGAGTARFQIAEYPPASGNFACFELTGPAQVDVRVTVSATAVPQTTAERRITMRIAQVRAGVVIETGAPTYQSARGNREYSMTATALFTLEPGDLVIVEVANLDTLDDIAIEACGFTITD